MAHEWLLRSEDEQAAFLAWRDSGRMDDFFERLRHAFNLYRAGLDPQDECIDFLEFRSTSGFVLYLQDDPGLASDARFIQDELKDRICREGYIVAVSDRIRRTERTRQESTEKHHLKPRPATDGPLRIQAYGNITLEILECKDQPCNLKMIVTSYHDRSWVPPLPFADLMERITD